METAFPYTDASHDEMPNIVTGQLTMEKMGLPPSVENQKAVLARVLCEVKAAQNGSGVFYWEPVWYCKKGVGVEKGQGNEWENQALFATNHNIRQIPVYFAAHSTTAAAHN